MIAAARFWTPRHGDAACPPRTLSEWPRSEEDGAGIDSRVVSRYGRLRTARGGDTVLGCTCDKAAVWYAPRGTNPCQNAWKWPQGYSVRDGYLLAARTVLRGWLITGQNQGKTRYYRSGPTVSQSISLKTSTRRRLSCSFARLQCEPFGLLGSREEYPNKCPFVSMPASLSTPLWTCRLKKKKNPLYIYKKCRYFYIFCMVLLKKKFLCIFYIYTDLLNLIVGTELKEVLIFFI